MHRSMFVARRRQVLTYVQHRNTMRCLCALTWIASFVLMLAGTLRDESTLQRWGLWGAGLGLGLWLERVARRNVTRLTQIIKMFVEDVPAPPRDHDEPHIRRVQ